MIPFSLPQLPESTIDRIARETAGMFGPTIPPALSDLIMGEWRKLAAASLLPPARPLTAPLWRPKA